MWFFPLFTMKLRGRFAMKLPRGFTRGSQAALPWIATQKSGYLHAADTIPAMSWSAAQYVTFEDERTRPVRDLLSALPAIDARSAIDLGCGPGNSTEVLAARFPNAAVRGLDSSPDMIASARLRRRSRHSNAG
jgi:SAM-dependent methyltransferase